MHIVSTMDRSKAQKVTSNTRNHWNYGKPMKFMQIFIVIFFPLYLYLWWQVASEKRQKKEMSVYSCIGAHFNILFLRVNWIYSGFFSCHHFICILLVKNNASHTHTSSNCFKWLWIKLVREKLQSVECPWNSAVACRKCS